MKTVQLRDDIWKAAKHAAVEAGEPLTVWLATAVQTRIGFDRLDPALAAATQPPPGLTPHPGKRHISAAVEPKPLVTVSNAVAASVELNAPCRRCGHPVGKHHKQENGKSPCILMGCNCSEYRSPE